MGERIRRDRPQPWREERLAASPRWALPFHRLEWWLSWASWALGRWALLEVLEHLGTLSILVAVIFYFSERGKRIQQSHYQAWQVINTAQGRGGNGGRIEALEQLNEDGVSLTGVDASGAFLQGIRLEHAELSRCDFHAADLRNGDLQNAKFNFCNLRSANLRRSVLSGADLSNSGLQDADLNSTDLDRVNLDHADLTRADLRYADARDLRWEKIDQMKLANIYGIKGASQTFLTFAMNHGAVSIESDEQWNVLLRQSFAEESTQ